MHDVFRIGIARPSGRVAFTRRQWFANSVYTGDEFTIRTQHIVYSTSHAGHEFHVDDNVRAVAQLHPNLSDLRTQRPH